MSASNTVRPVGRPEKFAGKEGVRIAKFVARIGNATIAHRILTSHANSIDGKRRPARIPRISISMPTLLKVVKSNGVELKVGRPSQAA